MKLSNPCCSSLLALVLLAPPRAAQEAESPYPVLSVPDVQVFPYHVQHTAPDALYEVVSEFVGRDFVLSERGQSTTRNLRLLGDTIVVYDTKEVVQRARDLFECLDVPAPSGSVATSGVVEYRPRFLSLATAASVAGSTVPVGTIEERSLIVLQGDSASNRVALDMLARVDVPEKQVLLTCQLVELSSGQGPALPKDLLDNLQKLLPGTAFTQVGMSLLKTSVGAGVPISIQIETTGKRYELHLTPVAFDEASASLTVAGCSLLERGDTEVRELFSTNTLLRGNEYTVLAATGATPRLLVLRFTVQG